MESLHTTGNIQPIWTQPQILKHNYELRVGDNLYATLRWEKGWGSLAVAETTEGSWSFKRAGFLHPHVTIRNAGAETDIAVYESRWNGKGTLQLPNVQQFQWVNTNFWSSQWGWQNVEGMPVLSFRRVALLKADTAVEIAPAMLMLPELPLLTTFGWYLMILMASDTAAATIGATTAATTASIS